MWIFSVFLKFYMLMIYLGAKFQQGSKVPSSRKLLFF